MGALALFLPHIVQDERACLVLLRPTPRSGLAAPHCGHALPREPPAEASAEWTRQSLFVLNRTFALNLLASDGRAYKNDRPGTCSRSKFTSNTVQAVT